MNKHDLRKRVLLDALTDPFSLIPTMVSATMLIASWGMGGVTWLTCGGIFGMFVSVGIGLTRMVCSLGERIDIAVKKLQNEDIASKVSQLDELQKKLVRDKDMRTKTAVANLRQLYEQFRSDLNDKPVDEEISGIVEALFKGCIVQLNRSYELWMMARKCWRGVRKNIIEERNRVIVEVEATVESLANTVTSFHNASASNEISELGHLREELELSLEATRQTQERLASFKLPSKDRLVK